ncbi:hypothetical protein ABPG75_006969 [Micractinium tetrahymenae]
MASTVSALQPARPCAPFSARAGSKKPQQRRCAVLVRADVKTAERGLTSGVQISGMRPTSPKAWELISKTLKKSGVSFVTADAVEAALKRGTPVVDIRPSNEFSRGRIPGSVNCCFYQPIEGWSPEKIVRRVGFSFFGVYGTEANPDFVDEVAAAVPKKNGGCILVCNIGGSLDKTGPSEWGRQSRSLTAAYELIQNGFTNIKVLQDGYGGWTKSEREVEMD